MQSANDSYNKLNLFSVIFDSRRNTLIVFASLLILFLRFQFYSDYKRIWIDEQISINAACGDSTKNAYSNEELKKILIKNTSEGNLMKKIFWANIQNDRSNAILFDFALSGWIQVFGIDPKICRAFSTFTFFFVLLLMLVLCKSENKMNLFLVLMILSNSLFFRYSLECRTYLFTTFLSLMSTVLLFKYIDSKKKSFLLIYFLFVMLSLFSHYLVVVVFIWHFFLIFHDTENQEKKFLMKAYAAFAISILALLFFIDQQTGFISSLIKANNNISAAAITSSHFKQFTVANLITGFAQVLSAIFGLSLQSFLKIRYFVLLLLIPFYLFYKYRFVLKKTIRFELNSLLLTHLLFLFTISITSSNTTIFQLLYSIFVLPYYLIYFAELTEKSRIVQPQLTLVIRIIIVSIGLIDTLGYIYLV